MKAILRTVILLFLFSVTQFGFAQQDTTKNAFEKGLDQYKLQKAKHLLLIYDFNSALAAYEEIHLENPDNLIVKYRIGEVHYALRDYQSAIKFMGMAVEKEPVIEEDARVKYAMAIAYLTRASSSITGSFSTAIPINLIADW